MSTASFSAIPIFLFAGCLPASLSAAIPLQEYVRGKVLTVHRVAKPFAVPLAPGDQTNNLAEGDGVLTLSGRDLSSLDGIGKLRVMDQGREIPLPEVKKLHVFLNGNSLTRLPEEFFDLQNVIFVYLYDNQFDAIPPQIAKMRGLLGMYFTAIESRPYRRRSSP